MNPQAALDPVPLTVDDDRRVFRVSGTRVTLDTLIGAFKRGATPEEIAQDYSAVPLADVYAAIAYCLWTASLAWALWTHEGPKETIRGMTTSPYPANAAL